MKLSAIVPSVLLSGLASAQDIQSNPFGLVVESADKSLNGKSFGTCHEGAGIESLCVGSKSTFHFNTTKDAQPSFPGDGPAGILTYTLNAAPPIPESLGFYTDPSTNVALPLFYPGQYKAQYLSFDKNDLLHVVSYLDDTESPPRDDEAKALYRWYVCESIFIGYNYQTLNWVLGSAKPQNPSCSKVDVKRVFI